MIKLFKGGSISTDNIGKNLVDVICDKEHQQIMKNIKSNSDVNERDLSLLLTIIYLFCCQIVTRRNSYHLGRNVITEIYSYFLLYLIKKHKQEYSDNCDQSIIINKVKNRIEYLHEIYTHNQNNSLIRVIEALSKEITTENRKAISGLLEDHIYHTITVIQDFFINTSFNKRVRHIR